MIRQIVGRELLILFVLLLLVWGGCHGEKKFAARHLGPRRIINLDGMWETAQGSMDSIPDSFLHRVPVPGLVDMASPAFDGVGKKNEKRDAFWYRRRFTIEGKIPDVAILKIHKAKYGTKVFLNGELAGEHLPCFTPALLDVKKFLKGSGKENELIVRVGANREDLPKDMPGGWDFEKYLYIPGIYDSVELILTGRPYILNVQTVPDISEKEVRVVTEVQGAISSALGSISYEVTEVSTGKLVDSIESSGIAFSYGTTKLNASIPIKNCKLWTPENPFLYELTVNSGTDMVRVRFGMRSFKFDKVSGRVVLNGKPYIMRGTNVCAYRFFEDEKRGDKPWRREWVRRLHRKFKSMHWNSIRYCIGFPPELWYEIADEEGFLIQDEFPIWLLSKAPENPKSEKIIPEYIEWMHERWNHPCVVIWDAQNESVTPETGKALSAVRHLDLSERPWDNGWAEPQSDADCIETHPYFFSKLWKDYWADDRKFALSYMAKISGRPSVRKEQESYDLPIITPGYGSIATAVLPV
jgi:beta-galactosidase